MPRSVNYEYDRKEAHHIGNRKIINTLDGSIIDGKEIVNLDLTLCTFILPRLKAFRLYAVDSCPLIDVDTTKEPKQIRGSKEYSLMFDEWLSILDKIILAFEYYLQPHSTENEKINIGNEEREKVIEEGFQLFGKYLTALW